MLRQAMHVSLTFLALSIWSFGQDQQSADEGATERVSSPPSARTIEWAMVAGVSVPALVTAFALFSVRKAIQALTSTHVAETVFRADTPEEATNRARTMATLFGKALPMNVEMSLANPVRERLARGGLPPYVVDARLGLLRLLAEFPQQRNQILADWEACFGERDSWPRHLREYTEPDLLASSPSRIATNGGKHSDGS
jgi:hypothetical protein